MCTVMVIPWASPGHFSNRDFPGGQSGPEKDEVDEQAAEEKAADEKAAGKKTEDKKDEDEQAADEKAADVRAAGKKAADKKAAFAEKETPAWEEALEQKMHK